MISFTVPGPPVPQSRPRVFRNGGVKTDSERVEAFKQACKICCPRGKFFHGAVTFTIHCEFKRPTKSKYDFPMTQGDVDNLAKAAMDALEGIVYRKDGQVMKMISTKEFSDSGKESAFITVEDYKQ